jgi:hypothetical protein
MRSSADMSSAVVPVPWEPLDQAVAKPPDLPDLASAASCTVPVERFVTK